MTNNKCKHCGRCCENMSITPIQAVRINRFLRDNPELALEVKNRLSTITDNTCIFLNNENACSIYSARPEICKIFGVRGVEEGLNCPNGTESTNVSTEEAQKMLDSYSIYHIYDMINMRTYYEYLLGILV